MASCYVIPAEVNSDGVVFDPIVAGVGGTFGFILGVILGVIITKYFLVNFLKRKFHIGVINHSDSSNLEMDEMRNGKKKYNDNIKMESFDTSLQRRRRSHDLRNNDVEIVDEEESSKMLRKTDKDSDLVDISISDILSLPSLELMIHKLSKQKLIKFQRISFKAWKNRHVCLLQIFKLIVKEFEENNQLSKSDCAVILKRAEKELDDSLKEYKEQVKSLRQSHLDNEHRNNKNGISPSNQAFTRVVLRYRGVINVFEDNMAECVGISKTEHFHDVLVKCFKTVEENIKLNHEYDNQVLTETFHRNVMVAQAFYSGKITLNELKKKRRHYFGVTLRRLSESERLSEEESDALWENIRDNIERKYNDINSEFQETVGQLQIEANMERKQMMSRLKLTKRKSLERFFADKSSSSAKQRIRNYFSMLMECRQQEVMAIQELNRQETAKMSELQKKAKLRLDIEYEEMQERFCEGLVDKDVLSNKEAQKLLNDLTKKNQKAGNDVSTINQIQTKIIEREATRCRSFKTAKKDEQEEDDKNNILQKKIVQDDLEDIKTFLSFQVFLTDVDRNDVIQEYGVNYLLLHNHLSVLRMQTYHDLDAELTWRQVKILMLNREEDRLASDEDINRLVEKLSDLRADYEDKFSDSYMQAAVGQSAVSELKHHIISELTADAVMRNLLLDQTTSAKLKFQTKALKTGMLNNMKRSENINTKDLVNMTDEGNQLIESTLEHLRQEHDIQAQAVKERLTANHQIKMKKMRDEESGSRPGSAASFSTTDVLDRLVEREKKRRSIDRAEVTGEATIMSQVFLQQLAFMDELQTKFQEVDKKILCQAAKSSGMKRNVVLQCVQEALWQEPESEKKKIASDLSQIWEKLNTRVPKFGGSHRGFQTQFEETREPETLVKTGYSFPKPNKPRRKSLLKKISGKQKKRVIIKENDY